MTERRAFQIVLALASLIPLLSAAMGLVLGAAGLANGPASASLDSQFRFLSGWYLGLAALIWWIIPRVEHETTVFRIAASAIFLGGLGRLVSLAQFGAPQWNMVAGVVVELMMPLLILWQTRIAAAAAPSNGSAA